MSFDDIAFLHDRKLRQRTILFVQVGDREKYPMILQLQKAHVILSEYTSLLLIIHGNIRDNTVVVVDVCLFVCLFCMWVLIVFTFSIFILKFILKSLNHSNIFGNKYLQNKEPKRFLIGNILILSNVWIKMKLKGIWLPKPPYGYTKFKPLRLPEILMARFEVLFPPFPAF